LNAHVISTRRPGINNQVKKEKEQLYVGTAESEHIEMYLKLSGIYVNKEKRLRLAPLPKSLIYDSPQL
jgi:hypothetical protein